MEIISTRDLADLKDSKKDIVLIDVLSEESYRNGHIPDAVNIPLDQIGSEALEKFEKDQTIVVYCKSKSCDASPKAAEKLEKLGFEDVKDYSVGLNGWKASGKDIEI